MTRIQGQRGCGGRLLPQFIVEAVPASGRGLEALSFEATDEADAALQARSRGAFPVSVRPAGSEWLSARAMLRPTQGPDLGQLAHFADQLSQLLSAGVPMEQALALMAGRTANARSRAEPTALQGLLRRFGAEGQLDAFADRLLTRIRQGASLSSALRAEPSVPASFYGVVQGAESAGTLATGLADLAVSVQQRVDTRQRVMSALAYPAGLALASLAAVLFVLTAVIPEFSPLFEGEEHRLPPLTRAVVWLSSLLTGKVTALLAIVALAAILAPRIYRRSMPLRTLVARVRRRIPIARHALRLDLAQGLRVLGSLLRGGMETSAAMQLAAQSTLFDDNRHAFEVCARQLREGASLSQVCSGLPDLPEPARLVLAVGERAGEAAGAAQRAAQWITADSQRRIARFVSLINPAAVITMGALVALIVAAVMMGILSISQLTVS